MVKEREAGTIEQLLMCPAGTYEIIVAKIAPLFFLLFLMVLFATGVIRFVFDVPFQGNILILFAGAALCILSGIGIGTVLATFSSSAFQAQLTSFFVNPLLTTASGAMTPSEAIPGWLQPLVKINPDGVMVIHPGSGGDAKCWPRERFLSLGRNLKRNGIIPTFILGEAEQERWGHQVVDALKSEFPWYLHMGLYELAEKLVDLEYHVQLWRFGHVKTVERIIGFRRGTGGSAGAAYLAGALERGFFPELFSLRTEM